MAPMVLIAHYAGGDRRHALNGESWVIGTHDACDLKMPDPTVSRRHARLVASGGDWLIEDLGSSNGTRLNGAQLRAQEAVRAGDVIQFGTLMCTLAAADADEVELAVPPKSLADRRNTLSSGIAPTTVSSDRLTRFFTDTLPSMTLSLCGSRGTAPAQAVGALADVFAGIWSLSRDGAVLASSGHDESGGGQTFESDGWTLSWSHTQPLDPLTFERVAAPVLALVRLRDGVSRPADSPAPSSDSPADGSKSTPPFPDPATRHDGLVNQYRQAARVSRAGLNVLIEGASGTGKELFARYLHACGRAGRPLVTLNCASLPQDLLDAELFGIEQGVATGVDARAGKFEQADGGVIFLDEIGDMHAATQAKLLRVLQEREVYRVGGAKPRAARCQVVSATNRNLESLVGCGEFRLDLYHRIADWTVRLPALEERAVDVANLAAHFLYRACSELGQGFGGISRAALDALHAYRWPGNVRELEREMKRCALFLDDGEALRSDHLDPRIRDARDGSEGEGLKALLARTEKRAIEQALQLCGGDVAAAAERLGVGKSTLYRQIRNLGIETG